MDKDQDENWHLDKRVPLAFISALLIQTMGMVWWASKIDSKADDVDARLSKIESARPINLERLSRLEADYNASKVEVSRRLDRIEVKIDRLLEQPR